MMQNSKVIRILLLYFSSIFFVTLLNRIPQDFRCLYLILFILKISRLSRVDNKISNLVFNEKSRFLRASWIHCAYNIVQIRNKLKYGRDGLILANVHDVP